MAQKSRRSKRLKFPLWLWLLVIVGVLWGAYRFYPRQSAEIFVVTAPLEYGDTTLTGVIQKDSAIGGKGNYYLVTTDGRSIMLDAQGIDDLVGSAVTVQGFLNPPTSETELPYMVVSELTSN